MSIEAVYGGNKEEKGNPEAAAEAIRGRAKELIGLIGDKNLEGALKEVNSIVSKMLDHGLLTIDTPSMDLTPSKTSIETMARLQTCLKASAGDPGIRNRLTEALGALPKDANLNGVAAAMENALGKAGINLQNTSSVQKASQASGPDADNKFIV